MKFYATGSDLRCHVNIFTRRLRTEGDFNWVLGNASQLLDVARCYYIDATRWLVNVSNFHWNWNCICPVTCIHTLFIVIYIAYLPATGKHMESRPWLQEIFWNKVVLAETLSQERWKLSCCQPCTFRGHCVGLRVMSEGQILQILQISPDDFRFTFIAIYTIWLFNIAMENHHF